MNLLSFILSVLPASLRFFLRKEEASSHGRCIAYIAAVFFLGCAYIFACIGLYQYFRDLWGEMEAFLVLGSIFCLTSLVLLITGWFFKPKKIPPALTNAPSLIESILSQTTIADSLSKKLSNASPIPLLAVLAFTAIATYLTTPKKKT